MCEYTITDTDETLGVIDRYLISPKKTQTIVSRSGLVFFGRFRHVLVADCKLIARRSQLTNYNRSNNNLAFSKQQAKSR